MISIIVPIYNAEKHLHRCIDSILAQTFTDFELLLINDGSMDNSGAICDEYATKDSRVRVFHKENGGVSSARNIGLDNAKGEWVTFIDSDDFLSNTTFLSNIGDIREDFVITSHIESSGTEKDYIYSLDEYNTNLHGKELTNFISQHINSNIIKAPWGKFFKKEIIQDLRFDKKIKCGEDLLFNLNYLISTQSCYIKHQAAYVYNKENTIFFSKYQQSIDESIYTLTKIYKAYKKINLTIPNFERNLFFDYKTLCQEEINLYPTRWYNNARIRHVYSQVKQHMGYKFRIRYLILRNQIVSRIWGRIKIKFYA